MYQTAVVDSVEGTQTVAVSQIMLYIVVFLCLLLDIKALKGALY